jgi:hypothetical protein
MQSEEELRDSLLDALSAIKFDSKFYEFADKHEHLDGMDQVDFLEIQRAIAGLGYSVRVYKRSRSFESISDELFGKCGFHVQVLRAPIAFNFSLALFVGVTNLSSTFASLAREIGLRRKKPFEHDPPYPKPTFLDIAEMKDVIRFHVDLFEQAKAAWIKVFKNVRS